jgi:hypothetical protein
MSEVESTELSARLHDAVDDHPVTVPDLLTPARSGRRRRRVLGGTIAVAVVLAGSLAVSQLLSRTPHTALVAATATATPAVTTPIATPSSRGLTNDTIVARCEAQLAKYETIHMYSYTPFPKPTDGWVVAHEAFAYHEGDLVGLVERGRDTGEMALCRIPAAGQESADVPFSAFDPSNLDEAGKVMRCSEELTDPPTSPTPGLTRRNQTTDLRGSTVVASETTDRTGILMLRLGSGEYLCSLLPVESFANSVKVTPLPVQVRGMKPYARGMAALDTGSTYFHAAGWLPENAASIEFSVNGRVVHRVTPAPDGSWVAAWKVVGPAKMDDATYTTRSASGAVLATGSMN